MSWPDTGPGEDGRRTAAQWVNAITEDMTLINTNIGRTLPYELALGEPSTDKVRSVAIALKEARRLQSDIYRFAEEIHGITREQIDRVGPL